MTKPTHIFLLTLLAAVFCANCAFNSTEPDCKRFRTGGFFYHSKIDNSHTIIERNDSIQTELSVETGSIVKARIIWTSACEYELHYRNQSSNSSDSIVSALKVRPLKTVILETGKDYYVFKSTMDGVDMVLIDTLKILKDKNL